MFESQPRILPQQKFITDPGVPLGVYSLPALRSGKGSMQSQSQAKHSTSFRNLKLDQSLHFPSYLKYFSRPAPYSLPASHRRSKGPIGSLHVDKHLHYCSKSQNRGVLLELYPFPVFQSGEENLQLQTQAESTASNCDRCLHFASKAQNPGGVSPYNCPEKIVLVVDTGLDANSWLTLIRGIELFLFKKNFIDYRSEFALMVLSKTTTYWAVDFTNDVNVILKSLRGVVLVCKPSYYCDLSSILEPIKNKLKLDTVQEHIVPDYEVRTILIFTRSVGTSLVIKTDTSNALLNLSFFTFDIVMVYDTERKDNYWEKTGEVLQGYANKQLTYFFAVPRNDEAILFAAMEILLTHPRQRPDPLQ